MTREQIGSFGAGRGSIKSYAVGFGLSTVLTGLAFWLVMSASVTGPVALAGIVSAAVVQILVQLHYFLHLDRSSSMRWNVMVFLFTLLIVLIFVGGTIWIMINLNYRMM
jgi:cytochrome o ubiquinol oxidase operon protein cyoD